MSLGCSLHNCMASSPVEQFEPLSIDREFARRGIRDALNGHPTGIRATQIRFFSPGEPTCEIGLLRECLEEARSILPTIRSELQTNGLFPDEPSTKWLGENLDIVWFSLDGPPSITDLLRPDINGVGRTKDIEQNLRAIAIQTAVGVRATIVESTADRQEELVRYYAELGVRHLAFNPVIQSIRRNAHGLNVVTGYPIMQFAEAFVRAWECAQLLNIELTSSLTFNFDERTSVACRSCLPMPQLNPDGSVSSCDMALYRDTKSELHCFIYGEWNPETKVIDYDDAKIQTLQARQLSNLPYCRKCFAAEYCAGGCAGRVAYEKGTPFSIIPSYCEAIRFLARRIPLDSRTLQATHP
jgi:radical SAM protein with 4Fe4S-binding SPASM domain